MTAKTPALPAADEQLPLAEYCEPCGARIETTRQREEHASHEVDELRARAKKAEQERDAARATNRRLNERCHIYESALTKKIDERKAQGRTMFKALALAGLEKASAERDALRAELEAEKAKSVELRDAIERAIGGYTGDPASSIVEWARGVEAHHQEHHAREDALDAEAKAMPSAEDAARSERTAVLAARELMSVRARLATGALQIEAVRRAVHVRSSIPDFRVFSKDGGAYSVQCGRCFASVTAAGCEYGCDDNNPDARRLTLADDGLDVCDSCAQAMVREARAAVLADTEPDVLDEVIAVLHEGAESDPQHWSIAKARCAQALALLDERKTALSMLAVFSERRSKKDSSAT